MPIYKYKNSKGQVMYYLKVSYKGKQYLKRDFASKKDAREYELNFIDNYQNNKLEIRKVTFKFASDQFLKKYKTRCKLSSFDVKFRRIHFHLISYFGLKRVNEITLNDFQSFIELKLKENLNVPYINKLISDLKQIFIYAKDYLSSSNDIYIKFDMLKDHSVKRNVAYISTEDFKKFLAAIPSSDYIYGLMFKTAYLTGLRFSEIVSLKVCNYNNASKTLTIDHQSQYITIKHSFVNSSPKTINSNRIVYLSTELALEIVLFINQSKVKNNHYLFFSKNRRKHIIKTTVQNKIKKYCDLAHIEVFRFHTLRKSFATNLIINNANDNIVAKVLGHDSINTTNKYYLALPVDQQEVIKNLITTIDKKLS